MTETVVVETTEMVAAQTTEMVAAQTTEMVAAQTVEAADRWHGTVSEVLLNDVEPYWRGHQPVGSISETIIMWNITPTL
jgi:hypothetical protein